jgi:hypothetical protein
MLPDCGCPYGRDSALISRLIETMDDEIVGHAEAKFKQLLARRDKLLENRRV